MCLLSQQSPAASSLEGAIWRRAGTQTRALDAILYHPQQSHLVGSTALGLTLLLLYPRELETQGWKKNLSRGCGRQTFWVGDVESFLGLEMVLNSYTSSGLCFVSPKTLPYQKPPLGPGLCEKSLGLKELKSPLCIYTLLSTLVSGYSKASILTTLHTDTHFSIPMPSF